MANHSSPKKELRKAKRRNLENKSRKTRIKTLVKKALDTILHSSKELAQEAFIKAQSEIMRGVQKNILNKNAASRKVSALSIKLKNKFLV